VTHPAAPFRLLLGGRLDTRADKDGGAAEWAGRKRKEKLQAEVSGWVIEGAHKSLSEQKFSE